MYQQREGRDACNFEYVLSMNSTSGNVQAIAASAKGAACNQTAPFTTPSAATVTGATKETFAADAVAPAWDLVPGGTATLSGIKWGVVSENELVASVAADMAVWLATSWCLVHALVGSSPAAQYRLCLRVTLHAVSTLDAQGAVQGCMFSAVEVR